MFNFLVSTLGSMLIVTSTRLLGEDIIILDALFVDLVFSPVSVHSLQASSFFVSVGGIRE